MTFLYYSIGYYDSATIEISNCNDIEDINPNSSIGYVFGPSPVNSAFMASDILNGNIISFAEEWQSGKITNSLPYLTKNDE